MGAEDLIMKIAEAAFRADCAVQGIEPNMGRSTPEQPRGFKTEAARWQAVARASLKTVGPHVPATGVDSYPPPAPESKPGAWIKTRSGRSISVTLEELVEV